MRRIALLAAAAMLSLAGGLTAATVPASAATRAPAAEAHAAALTVRSEASPVTAIAAHGSAGDASPAAATYFELNNYHTNGCIGIAAGQIYAGNWNCTGNADQTWHWGQDVAIKDNVLYRELVNGNNKCLGIAGGSTQPSARVTAYSCTGYPVNQGWVVGTGTGVGGYDWLVNYDGYAVGIANDSGANGAELVQFTPEFVNNQYWAFKAPA